MRDITSPEEKLLRLIRKGAKKETILNSPDYHPANAETKSAFTRPGHKWFRKHLSFLSVRSILNTVFIISCLYLISTLLYPYFGLREIKPAQKEGALPLVLETESRADIVSFDSYLKDINQREIFSNVAAARDAQPGSILNAELIKDIDLIGVILDKIPQAVIEDRKAQRTYYVTEGQYVGELQIEDIQEGKVILTLDGQRFELYL